MYRVIMDMHVQDDGGAPCLDHLSFHLEVLDCFHCFVAVCFGSLLKPSDGLSVTSCAVRACLVLRGILVGEVSLLQCVRQSCDGGV